MPPQLALALCFGLMYFLLRNDEKKEGKISGTFWLFSIWFMIIGSRSVTEWLQGPSLFESTSGAAKTGTESNSLNMILGLAWASLAIYTLFKRNFDVTGVIRRNVPFSVLIGYCLLSCLWSDNPGISFKRWVNMMIEISVVLAILSEPDRITATKKLFTRFAVFALPLSIVLVKYFSDMATHWDATGEGMMWCGICTHKNTLGIGLAVIILFYVWKWLILKEFKTIKIDLFLFVIAIFIMFNPEVKGSSTAILSLFASLGLLFCIVLFKNRIQQFMMVFYAIICLYFVADFIFQITIKKNILQYVALTSGRDMTFTGRTYIWDAVLEEAAKSPIVGTGYGMFWTGKRLVRLNSQKGVDNIYQSHNGYIETYANLGIVGLILLIIALFTSLNKRLRQLTEDYQFNSFAIALIVQCVLAEFFEASFLSGPCFRWILLLLFILDVPKNDAFELGLPLGNDMKVH